MIIEKELKKNKKNEEDNLINNNTKKTIIIKNLKNETEENKIENAIKEKNPLIKIIDIRIVKDKKGNSKGFAFVDLENEEIANSTAELLNKTIIDENIINCAVSKPPSLGENDNRTLFINNIPSTANQNKIREIFEKVKKKLIFSMEIFLIFVLSLKIIKQKDIVMLNF